MKKMMMLVPLAALLVVCTNCHKQSPTEPNGTDASWFASVIAGEDVTTSDFFVSDSDALDESVSLQQMHIKIAKELAGANITPLHWGRAITNVSRSVTKPTVNQGDTIAVVVMKATFTGNFVVQALSGTDTVVIRKPFTEAVTRYLKFLRVANTKYPRLNWRLDAVSVAAGGTDNANLAITKVEIVSPTVTLTVTDPANYFMQVDRWWNRHMPVFQNSNITMRVTVQSTKADTDIVALHYLPGATGLHHVPFIMTSETNNGGTYTRVYEKSWTVSGSARKYAHLMVSATTRESLYTDDASNFSSSVWGIPYKTSE